MAFECVFVNCFRASGTKKDGGTYDFCQLNVAMPLEHVTAKNRTVVGYGYDVEQFDINPQALPAFKDIKPFSKVSLIFEPSPDNPRRNWVIGIA